MAVDEVLKTFNKAVDRVLAHPPGPKRWRAANEMWLSLSSKNRAQYMAVAKENAAFRESLGAFNKFALGQEGNLRQFLNIPAGAYYAIQKADPEVFRKPENSPKFYKEFKEYRTAEAY